jgi:hypothetical protein
MDAEAFALARNVQLKQLADRFTQVGVDTAQAKLPPTASSEAGTDS